MWYVDIFIGYTFHTQIMYFYYRMRIIPFFKGSGMVCGCFISTVRWKYGLFSSFSLGGSHGWGIFPVIPLEFQGKKASITFYNAAFLKWENTRHDFSHALWCVCVDGKEGVSGSIRWMEWFKKGGFVMACGRFITSSWWRYGLFPCFCQRIDPDTPSFPSTP